MRRNYEPPRRQQPPGARPVGSLSSLTTLSASPSAPPAIALAPSSRPKNGIGGGSGGVSSTGGRSKAFGPTTGSTSVTSNSSRFVPGSPMLSVMGTARSRTAVAGSGSCSSNGDMHSAAAAGDFARVGEHLRVGADVDLRDGRQWSLLHHASFQGHLTVVRALLDAGADKEARTAIELTPLCLACQNGHQEVAEELLRRGAFITGALHSEPRAKRAGHEAGDGENDKVGGAGVGSGRPNTDPAPPTALFIAAREGHVALVDLLLKQEEGVAVSLLRGPDGKLAGEVFGKGLDEEQRRKIEEMLGESRGRAREGLNIGDANGHCGENERKKLTRVREDGGIDEPTVTMLAVRGGLHRSSSSSSSLSPSITSATARQSTASFPSSNVAAVAAPSMPQGPLIATPATRTPVASLAGQGASPKWREGRSVSLNSIGSGRAVSLGQFRRDSDDVNETSEGKNGARVFHGTSNGLVNGMPGIALVTADSSAASPRFNLAVEQPLSSAAVTVAVSPPVGAGNGSGNGGNHSLKPSGSGEIGGAKLPLAAPGLPTPQEWQASVRQQNGVIPSSQQSQTQQVVSIGASAAAGTPVVGSASIGLGTDSPSLAPLTPVDEGFDGIDGVGPERSRHTPQDDMKARSRRSRSAGGRGDYPNVEFGGSHWLNHQVPPRCATAPPPAARSPSTAHVPLSPASYGHSGGGLGGAASVGDKGDSDFEDKWGVAFSSLMDLRTLYRTSNRSGSNSRGAAWLAWEEERRSLEETISELNMRLAGKDHDIAELRMQIEERERDLRIMHGRDLELLGLSELDELEKCLQAALGLVSTGRERAVYKLLQQSGGAAGRYREETGSRREHGRGEGQGMVVGSDDCRPDAALRS